MQATSPCWAEMNTTRWRSRAVPLQWHSYTPAPAHKLNQRTPEGKIIFYFSIVRISQLEGPSQTLIMTLLGETCFRKTVHVSESGHMYNFSLLKQPGLGAKENQLQPIFTYSSCLETNKEQLNIIRKHLPVLYFIYSQKKEKETEILCTAYVCFTVCPASNSCQVVIYLLQQTINFPTATGNKQ